MLAGFNPQWPKLNFAVACFDFSANKKRPGHDAERSCLAAKVADFRFVLVG